VYFEASDYGAFLPSNVALEFTAQYQSVVARILVNEQSNSADK